MVASDGGMGAVMRKGRRKRATWQTSGIHMCGREMRRSRRQAAKRGSSQVLISLSKEGTGIIRDLHVAMRRGRTTWHEGGAYEHGGKRMACTRGIEANASRGGQVTQQEVLVIGECMEAELHGASRYTS